MEEADRLFNQKVIAVRRELLLSRLARQGYQGVPSAEHPASPALQVAPPKTPTVWCARYARYEAAAARTTRHAIAFDVELGRLRAYAFTQRASKGLTGRPRRDTYLTQA